MVTFLRIKRGWRASSPSLKTIPFPNLSSQNFEMIILFSIVERSSNYVFRDITHVNPHNYAVGPIYVETKCCFIINEKALCVWLPIRHLSNTSITTRTIKLKPLGILLLLLLLLFCQ